MTQILLSECLNKTLYNFKVSIQNDIEKYNILEILIYSNSIRKEKVSIKIDGNILAKSEELLDKNYITPNFIDFEYHNNFNTLDIYSPNIEKIIIKNREDRIIHTQTYSLENYNNDRDEMLLFDNKFAFIGDNHTYDSLKSVIDIDFLSSNIDIDNLNVDKYDFLFCETPWTGVDDSWNFDFDNIGLKKKIKKNC